MISTRIPLPSLSPEILLAAGVWCWGEEGGREEMTTSRFSRDGPPTKQRAAGTVQQIAVVAFFRKTAAVPARAAVSEPGQSLSAANSPVPGTAPVASCFDCTLNRKKKLPPDCHQKYQRAYIIFCANESIFSIVLDGGSE